MNQNSFWAQICNYFKDDLSDPSYTAWIKSSRPISFKDNTFVLEVQYDFHRDYWQHSLVPKFKTYAQDIMGQDVNLKLVTRDEVNAKTLFKNERKQQAQHPQSKTHLNKQHTFDTFIVGESNQLAQAAALAAAEDPGTVYSPLLIYGGVGLGKTHLMQAVGNEILHNHPTAKVKYVTSEEFTNEFVDAIKQHDVESFRDEYRNADALLVDDIQFFANKDKTQEEFFHTFNDLYNNRKQIVLTSDRLPNEIPDLQDRLVSRFASGLPTDIWKPDLQTRKKILQSKAQAKGIKIDDKSIEYIADKVNSNVRELEGALSRVIAYSNIEKQPLNLKLVEDSMRGLDFSHVVPNVSIDRILTVIGSYFKVSIDDLKGKRRYKQIVTPRQIAMYLCREFTDNSLPKIGKAFGGRDHTTVIHAIDKIEKALDKKDPDIQTDIDDLKSELQH